MNLEQLISQHRCSEIQGRLNNLFAGDVKFYCWFLSRSEKSKGQEQKITSDRVSQKEVLEEEIDLCFYPIGFLQLN